MSGIFPREIICKFLRDRRVIMATRCTCKQFSAGDEIVFGQGHRVFVDVIVKFGAASYNVTSTYGPLLKWSCTSGRVHEYILWLIAREVYLWNRYGPLKVNTHYLSVSAAPPDAGDFCIISKKRGWFEGELYVREPGVKYMDRLRDIVAPVIGGDYTLVVFVMCPAGLSLRYLTRKLARRHE